MSANGAPTPCPRAPRLALTPSHATRTQARQFQQAKQEAQAAPKRAVKRTGFITLRTLIDDGVLAPGPNVLYVDYKGDSTFANLNEDGTIECPDLGAPPGEAAPAIPFDSCPAH